MKNLAMQERLEKRIFVIRGKSVIIDSDLARLYEVTTKRLNEQVKRNKKRFPEDFMFKLTSEESNHLRSQFATSNQGGRRHLPYVFTEPGVAMLSSVLNSEKAIRVNIQIIRTFIKLREFISTHKELAVKLNLLEKKTDKHDKDIQSIFEAIRQIIAIPEKPKRKIGFVQ